MLCARVCEGDAAACDGVDGGDGEVWGGEAYDVMAKGVGGKYWILRVDVREEDLVRFCGVRMRVILLLL